jgi:hypothetical protein
MKSIFGYLNKHLREDFNAASYLIIATFLALSILLNYRFDLYKQYINSQHDMDKVISLALVYAIAYYLPLTVHCLITKNTVALKSFRMWALSSLGILILAVDTGAPYLDELVDLLPAEVRLLTYRSARNLLSVFTVLLPLIVLYRYQPHRHSFYGLTLRGFDSRPYFTILLILFPILAIASLTDNLGSYYPMYKSTPAHLYWQLPEWVSVLIYEFAYGWDFLTVEMMYRGFFVIMLSTCLGRSSVIAMASLYCVLHFGKPELEAISSIFGGYILGVIALETRSIYGGVIIHIGIAWMMELLGYLQKAY